MESILYYQTNENETHDAISHNGKKISPEETSYEELYRKLLKINNNRKKYKQYNSDINLYKLPNNGGFFIKNNFKEKDLQNRSLGFMYYNDTNDIKVFIDNFEKEALVCGKTYSDYLIKNMRKKNSFLDSKNTIFIIAIIFIIVIIFIILFNSHLLDTSSPTIENKNG